MAVIEITNLSKVYGLGEAMTIALDEVDLSINKGEFIAIMGPSGSGKSTLMNLIGLLDTPSHGDYKLNGKSIARLRGKARARIRRDEIGFIFQSFNLLARMRVIDNVALPLMYSKMSTHKRLKRASDILTQLDMQEREYYRPNQLSGGQMQRAAIARALVNSPSIILADEPTGNLDSVNGKKIMEILKKLHIEGNTLIMVTHDHAMAEYAERIIEMNDGKIIGDTADKSINPSPSEETEPPKSSKIEVKEKTEKKPQPKAKKKAKASKKKT